MATKQEIDRLTAIVFDWKQNKAEREKAAFKLGNIGEPAFDSLLRMASCSDSDLQYCALAFLSKIKDERLIEPLIELLNSSTLYQDLKELTISILASFGNAAVPALTDRLNKHPLRTGTDEVIRLLTRTKDPRALLAIIDFYISFGMHQELCVSGILKLNPTNIDSLIDGLKHKRSIQRQNACTLIGLLIEKNIEVDLKKVWQTLIKLTELQDVDFIIPVASQKERKEKAREEAIALYRAIYGRIRDQRQKSKGVLSSSPPNPPPNPRKRIVRTRRRVL